MIDFITFALSNDIFYTVGLLAALGLCAFLWREVLTIRNNYRLALKRIELMEVSIKDSDNPEKVVCRVECLKKLASIEALLKKLKPKAAK